MRLIKTIMAVCFAVGMVPAVLHASSGTPIPPAQKWSQEGIFGALDKAAAKRGAQVAVEVCMACHSISLVKFDQLRQLGLTEAEVKSLAEVQGRTKADRMNGALDEISAKDAFGVVPPDLSLITKARKGYEDYTYAILNGYLNDAERELVNKVMADGSVSDQEALELQSALLINTHDKDHVKATLERLIGGANFNKYFPGNFLAMPQPLNNGQVSYTDGTENSLKQLSHDVVTFLSWAAEPTVAERKSLGFWVLGYLFILTVLLYAVKRRIWAAVH
ncbi:MAG: cytochrome c1 [Magnetococcus sp. THC-1_WYH]